MKEFERRFDGFGKGLRRFVSPRDSEGLLECHNWMPMEKGLEMHEEITLIGAATNFFLLMESGDNLLLQTGDKIII